MNIQSLKAADELLTLIRKQHALKNTERLTITEVTGLTVKVKVSMNREKVLHLVEFESSTGASMAAAYEPRTHTLYVKMPEANTGEGSAMRDPTAKRKKVAKRVARADDTVCLDKNGEWQPKEALE